MAAGSEQFSWKRTPGGKQPCSICGGVLRVQDVRDAGTRYEPSFWQFVVGVCCWQSWNANGRTKPIDERGKAA